MARLGFAIEREPGLGSGVARLGRRVVGRRPEVGRAARQRRGGDAAVRGEGRRHARRGHRRAGERRRRSRGGARVPPRRARRGEDDDGLRRGARGVRRGEEGRFVFFFRRRFVFRPVPVPILEPRRRRQRAFPAGDERYPVVVVVVGRSRRVRRPRVRRVRGAATRTSGYARLRPRGVDDVLGRVPQRVRRSTRVPRRRRRREEGARRRLRRRRIRRRRPRALRRTRARVAQDDVLRVARGDAVAGVGDFVPRAEKREDVRVARGGRPAGAVHDPGVVRQDRRAEGRRRELLRLSTHRARRLAPRRLAGRPREASHGLGAPRRGARRRRRRARRSRRSRPEQRARRRRRRRRALARGQVRVVQRRRPREVFLDDPRLALRKVQVPRRRRRRGRHRVHLPLAPRPKRRAKAPGDGRENRGRSPRGSRRGRARVGERGAGRAPRGRAVARRLRRRRVLLRRRAVRRRTGPVALRRFASRRFGSRRRSRRRFSRALRVRRGGV
mmetsp:Transcript_13106/g.56995  ORF Transcript_13106/g.56995 Transcript_13106/m.56995 type:complete len:500 (+) Transcript_13106:1985-3484(+)